MGDRAQGRVAGEGRQPLPGVLVRVTYCAVSGALVTLVGGVTSLLVDEAGPRLLVWAECRS
ncbi:hypothetical protein [Streptomyces sp. NPDC051561]|uniref:hypothetical protein n=1 Tax=Streptomyces sp. NPDC051561 TaxID=3365658 RepID=UPI0037AE0002